MENSNYKWEIRKFNLYECVCYIFCNSIIMKINLYIMFTENEKV